ncbi:hypothetical protein LSAT2_017675 [Lamellibrachia satsuma]|nr:hypothetical protein LSAT2_017675 [Lamellibrachia satsuma]
MCNYNRLCCIKTMSGAQASDYRCTNNGGVCQNKSNPCTGGIYLKYICGGSYNRQCCIKCKKQSTGW